ncbi:MAG: VWA domain-containing protein [Bdellovibrionales bacterium]|nr:VWA domain-containing protein [Bdellovibrionales bacterium]
MFSVFNLFTSLFSDIQFLCKRLSCFLLTVMIPLFFSVSSPSLTAMAGDPEPLKSGARLTIVDADAKGSLFVEVLTQAPQKISSRNLQLDDIPAFLFGLNGQNKIEADEWTLFYNNLQSPDKSVEIVTRELDQKSKIYKTIFRVELGKIPTEVTELSLALATSLEGDAQDPMVKDLEFITTIVRAGENKIAIFSPQVGSLTEERAIFLLTLYRHGNGWKIRTQGDGFKGGFASLFESFGGARADDPEMKGQESAPQPAVPESPAQPLQPPPSTAEQRNKITLEKISKKAPGLVDLAKKVNVLVDKMGLGEIFADVLLVLDASGSMQSQYPEGVQRLINRIVPLALRLDPDGAIPCYAFASHCARLSIDTTGDEVGDSITLENYEQFVKRAQQSRMPYEQTTQGGFLGKIFRKSYSNQEDILHALGYDANQLNADQLKDLGISRQPYSGWSGIFPGLGSSNDEVALLEMLSRDYAGTKKPVLAIVVHDGGVGSSRAISEKIKSMASDGVPIFLQFVGWAGSGYGVLEKLDTLEGRRIDNTGFFALTAKDLTEMPEEVLLQKILKEFPAWLKAAEKEGIIQSHSCRERLL